jgi:hypothetical protein
VESKAGLITSLNRPGGNLTGVNLIAGPLPLLARPRANVPPAPINGLPKLGKGAAWL